MASQRLSTWLALRCREPLFQRFLRVPSEALAAHSVRAICEVKSRGDIDRDQDAQQRFHKLIRLPYQQFQQDPQNHPQD